MVLDTCYKAMFNSLTRRNHEKNENGRLIEKKERIETIAESMRQHGTNEEEIQELVSFNLDGYRTFIAHCLNYCRERGPTNLLQNLLCSQPEVKLGKEAESVGNTIDLKGFFTSSCQWNSHFKWLTKQGAYSSRE